MWKKTVLAYGLAVVAILSLIGWQLIIGPADNYPGHHFNQGKNATWLRHSWVDTNHDWEIISDLVKALEGNGIHYVYVHTGPLEPDGTVPDYRYIYAKNFLDKAKAINPKIEFYAWLGQKREKIDLDDEKVRQNVVDLSKLLVFDVGFKGIHYDIETIDGDDRGFIKLVKATDKALSPAPVSVALEEYIPSHFAWVLGFFVEMEDQLSANLLKEIAPYVHHIVIMTYDTKVDDAWIYQWLVKQEVIAITRLLPKEKLLIAIPTYDDQRASFNPDAENMLSGLQGLIDGLNSTRSNREAFEGVAMYSFWETDYSEWETYRNLWLKP